MDEASPSEEQVLRDVQRNTGSSHTGEDGDFAIAKALQEQERAFLQLQSLMQRENRRAAQGEEGDDSEDGPVDEHDSQEADDSGEEHIDEDDEAFARRLQEEADREHYARLIELTGGGGSLEAAFREAGIAEEPGSDEDYDANESYEEDGDYLTDDSIDPDEMTYEELQALGEAVGHVSRGLSQAVIDALPRTKYRSRFPSGNKGEEEEEEQCAVCRMEFEPEEEVVSLPCKHLYHGECISQWLKDRKACPICGRELMADGKQAEKGRDATMEQPASK